jgi:competence protein ComEC
VQEAQTLERDVGAGAVALPVTRPSLPQARTSSRTEGLAISLSDAVASRRLFVLLPFAMIAGLIAYAQLPFEPQSWALIGVASGLALATFLLRSTAPRAMALLAAFWIGFCLLALHGTLFGTQMLARPAFGMYEGRVDEIVSSTPEARRVVVSNLVPVGEGRSIPIERARLVVPPEPPLAPGDTIRASMRLAPVPGPILPGAFDGQFHAYFSGIGAYGNVTGDFVLLAPGDSLDPARAIEGLRMAIGARIDAVLDGPSAAIGRAMVVGDQSAIDDETRESMAASGLAHIYSISGLHLSIVAGGIYFLLRLGLASMPATATQWPVKKLAAATGILAALAYLLLAGGLANVPAFRSTIMLALIFGAVLAGRRALTMRNVAITALLIIVIDPASVFRASFQLSFAAVVALIGIYEMPRPAPEGQRHWGRRLWATIWATALTSFIAGTATLLFSAYHFQQTAPLGVLGNVLVLPVVSLVIMPFAVLSVLAMPFGIESPFVAVMGWGIDRMVDGAALVAGWSGGLTGNPLLTGTALIIGLVALAWFAFINTWWRLVGPAVALPLVLLVGLDQRPDLLIADTTQAVALRTADGMGLVSGQADSFAVEVWGDYYQEVIAPDVPAARCDSLGCVAQTPRFSLAVTRNAAAFAEDCGRHDLIVARMRVPANCAPQVIDANALSTGGVHWLRWNEAAERFDIRTAIPNVTRPWRVAPR